MELQFHKQAVPCLQNCLYQVQNLEQTQELRVPEGMSGIGRILGCWGQVLIRSKIWQGDSLRLTGGTLVWLLYAPEEGTTLQRLESWIPFQMDWELPEGTREGKMQVKPLLRFADARSVSAGKVLIRVGLGVLAQGWVSQEAQLCQPETVPEDVELLRESIPMRLPKEAGEKTFDLEDRLTLPPSAPRPDRLVYYRMEPQITDCKVLSNKVVFRGNGNLHLLYTCEDGQLHSWDFEVPFSQYGDLEESHSGEAQAAVTMAVTALELEADGEGALHLKTGMTGQYLVSERQTLELVRDAWSPRRSVEAKWEDLELPALLDSCRERICGTEPVHWEGNVVADAVLLPDFPRQRREGDHVQLELPVVAQVITDDGEGTWQGRIQRMDGQYCTKADPSTQVTAIPADAQLQVMSASLDWEVPLQISVVAGQGLEQVTGLSLGELREPDPARPSLILRRAGNDQLWDIAKESGSTVAAIMEANGLTGQPAPGKMLLIPVL